MKLEFHIRLRDLDLDSHSKSGIVKWEDQVTKVRPGYRKRSQKAYDTRKIQLLHLLLTYHLLFPPLSLVAQMIKNPPAMQEMQGLISGLGRSPGEGYGYPLQYRQRNLVGYNPWGCRVGHD